jgi:hypothetical protein
MTTKNADFLALSLVVVGCGAELHRTNITAA